MFVILAASMTGCNSQIKDYIGRNDRQNPVNNPTPDSAGKKEGYKISPSAGRMAGTQVKAQYAVTHSKLSIKGTQVKATVAIQARSTQ